MLSKKRSFTYRIGSQEFPIAQSTVMRGPNGRLIAKAKTLLTRTSRRKPLPPDPDEIEPPRRAKSDVGRIVENVSQCLGDDDDE